MNNIPHSKLPEFARSVLEQISAKSSAPAKKAFVVALSGNLGAGKTTFMQALAKEFGVQDIVQSPTYVLMKSYPISFPKIFSESEPESKTETEAQFTKLIHIDAYRLNNPEEFQALKPEEFLHDPHNLVCIEWPERVEGVLPKPDLTLKFSSDPPSGEMGEAGNAGDDSRYIEVV